MPKLLATADEIRAEIDRRLVEDGLVFCQALKPRYFRAGIGHANWTVDIEATPAKYFEALVIIVAETMDRYELSPGPDFADPGAPGQPQSTQDSDVPSTKELPT